jgi:hypothetical protein
LEPACADLPLVLAHDKINGREDMVDLWTAWIMFGTLIAPGMFLLLILWLGKDKE